MNDQDVKRCLTCGKHDVDLRVSSTITRLFADEKHIEIEIPTKFLDSYISRTGETWRELIEREICRQAALLPCTAWEVEYEGD